MIRNLTKFEKGLFWFAIIFSACVIYALYISDQSKDTSDDAKARVAALAIANEQNRYENCLEANKAIAKLNVVVRSQKQVLALAQESPEVIQSGRAVKYAEISKKLTESAKLNCLQPRIPTGAVGATGRTP